MTDKKTYWLVDPEGAYAVVAGVEERDRWIPQGWTEAEDEPTGTDRIWAWHEGIEHPAAFPADIFREVWEHKEWRAGPPPGSDHPFAELPASVEASAPAGATTKPATPAAGGSSKEK